MSKLQPLMAVAVGSALVLSGCSTTSTTESDNYKTNYSIACALAGSVIGGAGLGAATGGGGAPAGIVGGFIAGGELCGHGSADSDNDGVTDDMDQCPNTPEGVQVNSVGCALDSDGDGVPDRADQCPNTPAGTPVDAQGCALDSDNDGVTDDIDECPNTPAGTDVDAKGCAIPVAAATLSDQCQQYVKLDSEGTLTDVTPVLFAFDSAVVNDRGHNILNCVANATKANSQPLKLDGYTDSIGDKAYNKRLSQRRANSAREILLQQGVKESAIDIQGHGEQDPVVPNTTPKLRHENRRVEISHQ